MRMRILFLALAIEGVLFCAPSRSEYVVPAGTQIDYVPSVPINVGGMNSGGTFTQDYACGSNVTSNTLNAGIIANQACINQIIGSGDGDSEQVETNRQSISTNADNIEINRKNINDLGYGVAGATALNAALSSLPIAADDAPFSCGVGTGGYSSRFAVGIGCASRFSDRLSINVGGSHVFGGSSNYGGGSLDTFAARGGFIFKLGKIHKPSSIDTEELQSQLDDVKQENKELLARLERLEAIALGRHSEVTAVSIK